MGCCIIEVENNSTCIWCIRHIASLSFYRSSPARSFRVYGKEENVGDENIMSCLSYGSQTFKLFITRDSSLYIDSKKDFFFFLFVFLLPPRAPPLYPFSSFSRSCSPLLFYPPSCTRRAFTYSCNYRKETSTGARNFYHTMSFSFAQGCISERITVSCRKELRIYMSDKRSFRKSEKSHGFMYLLKRFLRKEW